MRSAEEANTVQRLIAAGMNDCAIARQTGIPRRTVCDLRRRPLVRPRSSGTSPCVHDFYGLPADAYCYLLGLYLGDGCLSQHAEHGISGLPSIRNTRASSTAVARPSTRCFRRSTHRLRRGPADASTYRTIRSTGHACCLSMVPERSTPGRFGWSPGKKCSSNRRPRNSFAA